MVVVTSDTNKSETFLESAVAYLEKSLFIRASELLARVMVAAKDASGKVNWVTLDSVYHSVLVKTAVGRPSIKEALFIFLLGVLNGKPQSGFFASKEVESKSNRANRERKRLARKRSQSAKRNLIRNPARIGASELASSKPSGSTRTCLLCEVKFASRKKLSRHSCKVKQANEAPPTKPTGVVSDAKRARRAKARKARRDVVKVEKAKIAAEKSAAELAAKKLKMLSPVTDASGKTVECENCTDHA
ncbi:hypothetical protein EDB83DRAFT_2376463, partial [Lactarius deliciosus]